MPRRPQVSAQVKSRLDELRLDYLSPSTSRRRLRFDLAFHALEERSTEKPARKELTIKAGISNLDRFLKNPAPHRDEQVRKLSGLTGVDPRWLDEGIVPLVASMLLPEGVRKVLLPHALTLQGLAAIEIWRL
jgi:hypothetical protein